MKTQYTIATKGIHGGYSNINKYFDSLQELETYIKNRKDNKDFKK